ncbi:helix-turn-helix transcriptional regulator [Bacillus licheniformis]|uniref:helix-turn-helix transcriptional regulator n=1 Tax=Bacillus licheniformis TaxID=1402 RepID=UPI000B8A9B6C|nr:helix-turn-helix transcriptional regulator [Bacillus licheniformis]MED0689927.1 helix-turn-helix transcriptional regulator [Bacillus licheniformis]MED0713615.1 helix-turn-helix transcriptional regulator [Bacillus licheniformis]MED0789268.1 helix-turn-helix transcriptional regulator [Bacillus licheniformis]TWM10482.1 hypothetical protein CHCC15091_0979 [Bacillus licheniformis]WIW99350.1 helix-turn-helix transcriptional regulator [Bacillus licheniformis]
MHKELMAERRARKITQKEIADAIGMATESYGRKERGQRSFELEEAADISKFLKVPIDKLFPEFFADV